MHYFYSDNEFVTVNVHVLSHTLLFNHMELHIFHNSNKRIHMVFNHFKYNIFLISMKI